MPADRWADDIARAVGADPGLLAPLGASAEAAGALMPAAAERLGLPEGLPVTAGAADVAAGILGAGLSRPGELQLTLGTGGQFVTLRDSPEAVADAGTHLYRTAQPRGWYAMAATLNVGLALDWVRRVLGATWEELYATAGPPRSEAPIFLPHLVGERTPHLDPDLRAAWSGLALGHERADLLRSALEGVALSLREALEALAIPGDVSVRLTGGGSVHPGWRQMLADLLDRPIAAVEAAGASARGAALLAGIAVEQLTFTDAGSALAPVARVVAEPDPTAAEHLASRFARFRILAATAARQAGADRERASGGSAR